MDYGDRDTVVINGCQNYQTVIILPEKEEIVEATAGNKDAWQVAAKKNTAWIKALFPDIESNVLLITIHGNSYTFFVKSNCPAVDFKVYVNPTDDDALRAINEEPRYVARDEYRRAVREREDWQTDALKYKREIDKIKEESGRQQQEAVAKAVVVNSAEPPILYEFERNVAPFRLEKIWGKDGRTYIKANPEEAFGAFEMKDGKHSVMQVEKESEGLYRIDHPVQHAILRIGTKKKTEFKRIQ